MTYLKVSILVREWALGRWEEGEQVSLAEELGGTGAASSRQQRGG